MAAIQVLDKHVAELIAAGEVVERPASVVKEMMENCIDAGARHITVEIRDGGVSYMRIADDGCGISREDVPTAFLRHATSKVRHEADLAAIGTLGFRGEALASVAAVAWVELTTCARGELAGTRYVIRGGEELTLEDAGCPEGSTFVVEDLFYNVPARMKFLKKDVSEGNAVAGVVERLALSHPEIAVRFVRGGRTELQTPGDGNRLACIRAVFGKPFAAGLLPVDYSMDGVRVHGFVCKPEACRQNRTMQHFFVNGRYVKTQTAMIAMERAYKGVMMAGRFPTCVLCLDMPPETVDANIHPAKIEVRFINEKPVFDAVYFGVKSALESGDSFHRVLFKDENRSANACTAPTPSRPSGRPAESEALPVRPAAEAAAPAVSARPPLLVSPPTRQPSEKPAAPAFLDLTVDEPPHGEVCSLEDGTLEPYIPRAYAAASAVSSVGAPAGAPAQPEEPAGDPLPARAPSPPETPAAAPAQLVMEEKPPVRLLGELFVTYILAEMGDSLFIIDKHAAHERILYNRFKAQEHADAQLLLAPVSVSVSREEHTALMENLPLLQQAGIELEDFGGHTVLVRAFPMLLSGADIPGTVREIAAGLADNPREVSAAKLDWIYHSSACRAAAKAGDSSKPAELQALVEQVLLQDDVRYCPHGRPVCIEMNRRELEKQFGRVL